MVGGQVTLHEECSPVCSFLLLPAFQTSVIGEVAKYHQPVCLQSSQLQLYLGVGAEHPAQPDPHPYLVAHREVTLPAICCC